MFFKRANHLQDYFNAVLTIIFFINFFLYTENNYELMNISSKKNIYIRVLIKNARFEFLTFFNLGYNTNKPS